MSDDFYHDDPIERKNSKKFPSKLLSSISLIIASVFFFQTTFAGNITLNSNSGIEFGQGFSQTVACSGSNNLTITPNSTFANASGGGGTYNFSSVTVSGIPVSCDGAQFQINAYGNTDQSPLALYNSTTTDVIVADTSNTFRLDTRASGITLTTNSASSFTVTFDTPVATSASVFKLTVQSSTNSIQSGYQLGDTGPGGGKIFYYSAAGFNCGPTHSATGSPSGGLCNYLEVAPSGWSGPLTDPRKAWAVLATNVAVPNVTRLPHPHAGLLTDSGVGLGYKDSVALVNYGESTTASAVGAARAYAGGSKNDWYLGSPVELSLLCQWARGVPSNITSGCTTSGVINSSLYNANSAGLTSSGYWSSTQDTNNSYAFNVLFQGSDSVNYKIGASLRTQSDIYVRPIRAF